ncbi:hypothetical protein [Metamycoplasma equirhinis]|uniref:hypothetical protein n=1 Tax=Metamycoplasma equirhinis TaxID=92402 RepID=UPI0035933993
MKLRKLTYETNISLYSMLSIVFYIFSFTALLSVSISLISKLNYDSLSLVLKSNPMIFVCLTIFLVANILVITISICGIKYANANNRKELKKFYLLSAIILLGFGSIISLVIASFKILK